MKHFWISKVAQTFFNEGDGMIETSDAIRVSTMEIYDNFLNSMRDSIWSHPNDPNSEEFLNIAKGIASGSASIIRNAFIDGFTAMLLGTKITELDLMENKEIRVYHKHNSNNESLICVIIDREISY